MAEALPLPEGSLTLKNIIKELGGKVASKWLKIGIHVDVPYEKLLEFKNDDYPLAAVLNYCLKGNVSPPLSWAAIVSALKSDDIGEAGLAEEIDKKYCRLEKSTGKKKSPSKEEKAANSIPQVSLRRKGKRENPENSPYAGCYVFVNHSNLWKAGQRVQGKKLRDTDVDKRYRIDLGKFLAMLVGGRNITQAYLYGSKPPPNDSVWKAARERNYTVKVYDRSWSGKEKELNTSMAHDITKCSYTLDLLEKDDTTFIIVTGDRDLKTAIDDVLANDIPVELWSWQDSMARELRQLANTNALFTAQSLDGVEDKFGYTSYMSCPQRAIDPSHAIVYRDVPNNKEFLFGLADHLHQLMRIFYITPLTSQKPGKQDLVIEFPKTNPGIILNKLRKRRNFRYQPCSWPEYYRIQPVQFDIKTTNRFESLIDQEVLLHAAENLELESLESEDSENPELEDSKSLELEDSESDCGEEITEDPNDWKSVVYKNPALMERVRKSRDSQCKWGDHCAKASQCLSQHTDYERKIFAKYPNLNFKFLKIRQCSKMDSHVTEEQKKWCNYAHDDKDSWCLACRMYGHLTDNCKFKFK